MLSRITKYNHQYNKYLMHETYKPINGSRDEF